MTLADYPHSWYAATATGAIDRPRLEETLDVDACVIGGGLTGLSAALHLAERGYSVALLEAERVGWGASGRNGGLIGSGQRRDVEDLEALFGERFARQLWDLAEEGKQLVRDRARQHAIDCYLRNGQLEAAWKASHARELKSHVAHMRDRYDYPHMRYIERDELVNMLGSTAYHGAILDKAAAHMHPLNYALGLARACDEAGVTVFERSRVIGYSKDRPSVVRTRHGSVRSHKIVLACNAYLGKLEPRIAPRIMPINNFILVTEPLGEDRANEIIRGGFCVHDTRFVVNYYRMTPDHRLLFGGGENYRRSFPGDIKRFVRRYMLQIFPQLDDAAIDYAWGGTLAITMNRLPHFGHLEPNLWFAQGYSGHGLTLTTLAGKLIAEAVDGMPDRFDAFRRMAPPRFPGGTLLRWPGMVAGMLYYSLRDRLL